MEGPRVSRIGSLYKGIQQQNHLPHSKLDMMPKGHIGPPKDPNQPKKLDEHSPPLLPAPIQLGHDDDSPTPPEESDDSSTDDPSKEMNEENDGNGQNEQKGNGDQADISKEQEKAAPSQITFIEISQIRSRKLQRAQNVWLKKWAEWSRKSEEEKEKDWKDFIIQRDELIKVWDLRPGLLSVEIVEGKPKIRLRDPPEGMSPMGSGLEMSQEGQQPNSLALLYPWETFIHGDSKLSLEDETYFNELKESLLPDTTKSLGVDGLDPPAIVYLAVDELSGEIYRVQSYQDWDTDDMMMGFLYKVIDEVELELMEIRNAWDGIRSSTSANEDKFSGNSELDESETKSKQALMIDRGNLENHQGDLTSSIGAEGGRKSFRIINIGPKGKNSFDSKPAANEPHFKSPSQPTASMDDETNEIPQSNQGPENCNDK